jgi:L-alanine-DL-glutamate epimerase-like enolase superfamily enzyme
VVNLRISKHGGLLRSIKMAESARARGLAVIIGSHVGETSLLTRTALTLAAACGDQLLAAECGYGSYLLRRDLTDPALRFGRRGVLKTQQTGIASAAGLGLMVDEESLLASFT